MPPKSKRPNAQSRLGAMDGRGRGARCRGRARHANAACAVRSDGQALGATGHAAHPPRITSRRLRRAAPRLGALQPATVQIRNDGARARPARTRRAASGGPAGTTRRAHVIRTRSILFFVFLRSSCAVQATYLRHSYTAVEERARALGRAPARHGAPAGRRAGGAAPLGCPTTWLEAHVQYMRR